MTSFDCFKCGGTGEVAFRHIEGGVCFQCKGTGKLAYRLRAKAPADPHPEMLVPIENRPTQKQWDYLVKLCGDRDAVIRQVVAESGAPMATDRYMTRAQMSRAIEIAKTRTA